MQAPQRIEKPWGYEIWWAHTDSYAGKLLQVEQGHRLSLQYHQRKDESCYVAGDLVGVYSSTEAADVSREARLKGLVVPPFVVVHVTVYMLALTHQGQEGFRVWVIESDEVTHEQYVMSLVDMVRANWTVRRTL